MPREVSNVLCDLDGVVWLAHTPIVGSVEALARLRTAGCQVWFVTNNSAARRSEQADSLRAIGVDASPDQVVSSAMSAAFLVQPGERVLVAGGPGVVEALTLRGAEVVINTGDEVSGRVDAVVAGLHRDFDYARLRTAARAVHNGARLIGTNRDTTYPTPSGLDPGGGSLVVAIATVAGVEATFAGKPDQPMADLVAALLSEHGAHFDPATTLMIGDRLDTDGLFAKRLGCRFALVESGVTPATPDSAGIDLRAVDLAALVDALDS